MPLAPGSRLGAYEIVALIGCGGMGEVYRARDPRLQRDVAVKVLQAVANATADSARQLEQEARAAAALAHPHIVAIHDIGTIDGTTYLVSELLHGQTLRAVLDSGRVSTNQAVEWATHIADGLDAAHQRGIVHRDLKPENIFITADGRAKILDFGLASFTQQPVRAAVDETITSGGTMPGLIIGTLGYMSPEQARGIAVDQRSDIFSFGAILYELFSGNRAFAGATPADTLSAILSHEPADRPFASANDHALNLVIRRCLDKNPSRRFASAADAAFAVRTAVMLPAGTTMRLPRRRLSEWRMAMTTAVVAIVVAALIGFRGLTSPTPQTYRFTLSPPEGTTMGTLAAVPSFAVSPDGRHVVSVVERGSQPMLALHSLDTVEGRVIAGTDGARAPFWSPDGRQIGFYANRQLRKITLGGAQSELIWDFSSTAVGLRELELTAAWAPDDTIVFSGAANNLMQVSASGGTAKSATPALTDEDVSHYWPDFLPDGRHFLFSEVTRGSMESTVRIGSIDGADPTTLRQELSRISYVDPGFALFVRQGTLHAQRFDWRRRSFDPRIFAVANDVAFQRNRAAFSASDAGAIVFRSPQAVSRLVWVDRTGSRLGSLGDPGDYSNQVLSPDEQRVALEVHVPDSSGQTEGNIWIATASNAILSKLTFGSGAHSTAPVWSPDGGQIVYRRGAELIAQPVAQAGNAKVLATGPQIAASAWSDDGRWLVYELWTSQTRRDIWLMPMTKRGTAVPLVRTPADETHGRLTGDGRWIAYTSDESGRREVYVRRFPEAAGKWQVSSAGGQSPRWRGDGRELYYYAPDGYLMVVALKPGANTFEFDRPTRLFAAQLRQTNDDFGYDVTRDGTRFLLNEIVTSGTRLNVITNWRAVSR